MKKPFRFSRKAAVKIAIPLSLTGRFSALGKKARDGIALWKKYFGSHRSQPLEVVIEDDESSPEKVSAVTEKFCADRTVDAVFGPYSSSLALAAAKSASASGRTLWNHGGAADEIARYENTVSALTPASGYFLPLLPNFFGKEIFIANASDSGFSRAVCGGAEKFARRMKIKIRRFEYKSGAQNFGRIIKEIQSKKPFALLSAGRMEDDINLAKQILTMREKPQVLCFVAAGVDDFSLQLGEKSEGVYSVSQWEENASEAQAPDFGPAPSEFAKMFRKQYGASADYPAAQAFNIGLVFQKCVEISQTADDKILRETARKLDFTTFYGRFKIDKNGKQIGHKTVVTKWENGKRILVKQFHDASWLRIR